MLARRGASHYNSRSNTERVVKQEARCATEGRERALCQVGPGTLMGDLMRQYWMPYLYGFELEPDGPPLRVRLLGEDLITFRDSDGEVGLIAANCPHRGASLFFGRNEDCGIRCVYHGWKFDISGQCVDMPSEPAKATSRAKSRPPPTPRPSTAEWSGPTWAPSK